MGWAATQITIIDPPPVVRECLIRCLSNGGYVRLEQAATVGEAKFET